MSRPGQKSFQPLRRHADFDLASCQASQERTRRSVWVALQYWRCPDPWSASGKLAGRAFLRVHNATQKGAMALASDLDTRLGACDARGRALAYMCTISKSGRHAGRVRVRPFSPADYLRSRVDAGRIPVHAKLQGQILGMRDALLVAAVPHPIGRRAGSCACQRT